MMNRKWSDSSPGYQGAPDAKGLDTARGLIIGLALSQVFWIALAFLIF